LLLGANVPPLSTPVRQLTQSSNVTLAIGVGGTLNGIAGILDVGPQDFEALLCTASAHLAYLSKTDMTAAETAQRFSDHGRPHAAAPAGRLIETQWLPAERLCANLCPA
jgi:hypothetical protein